MLAALRLTTVFALLGLFTSRVALIVHELGGHAVPAVLVGSREVSWKLFWFAGGYVRFERPDSFGTAERLFVSLGGIGLELVLAAAGAVVARRLGRGSLARVAVLGFTAVVLVHALYYLTTGAFHGYGDGWYLHHALGAARPYAVAVGCLAVLGCGFAVARMLARDLDPWLAGRGRAARLGLVTLAVVVAGGVHGGLSYGEVELRGDRTYGAIMQPQSARDAERDLARYVAALRARGAAPTPAAVADKRAELERRHRRFPLRVALGMGLAAAVLAGLWTRLGATDDESVPGWRAIAWLALATAAAVGAIGVIGLLS